MSPPSPSPPPPSPSPPPPSRTVTTLGLPADAVVLAGQRPRACPLPEALGDFSHTMLHVGARVRALRRRSAVGSKLAAGLLSTTVSEDARSRLNVRPGGTPPRSEPVSDVHKVFFPPNSSHICTQAPGNNCSALLGRSDTGGEGPTERFSACEARNPNPRIHLKQKVKGVALGGWKRALGRPCSMHVHLCAVTGGAKPVVAPLRPACKEAGGFPRGVLETRVSLVGHLLPVHD